MTDAWPQAHLSPVARLHALAAGMPGTVVVGHRFDRPFDTVWSWITDLPRSVPAFDRSVASLAVRPSSTGHRYAARARSSWRLAWVPQTFDVDLDDDGWCLMVARNGLYVVAMAAEPDGDDATRFAHLEGVPGRAGRWLAPVLRPSRRRHVAHDLAGMDRELR